MTNERTPQSHTGWRFVAAALSLSFVLASCSDPSPGETLFTPRSANTFAPNGSGTISTNGTEPQSTLLPTDSNDSGGGRVVDQLFEGLVSYGSDGRVRLEAALNISSDDNVNWKVTVKPEQMFTDGTPVTAESFVDAWNFGALATNRQANSAYFSVIAGYDEVAPRTGSPTADSLSGLDVVDTYTFTVRLMRPVPNFIAMLGYRAFFPLPKVAFQDLKAFGDAPIGNGPYKMKSSSGWQHDQQIQLVRNPGYKGARTPRNGGITFVLYRDTNLAYKDIKSNNLDVLSEVPPVQSQSAPGDLGLRALTSSGAGVTQLVIPQTLQQFGGDKEGLLRRAAMSHLINRTAVCDTGAVKVCEPARDFTSYTLEGFNAEQPGNEVLNFDPDAARALWSEANAIKPFAGQFKVAYNADDPMTQVWAQAITANLRLILGVDSKSVTYESLAQLRSNVEQRYLDAAIVTRLTPAYPDALAYLQPNFGSEAGRGFGANDGDYSSPEFDAALHAVQEAGLPTEIVASSLPKAETTEGDDNDSSSSANTSTTVSATASGAPVEPTSSPTAPSDDEKVAQAAAAAGVRAGALASVQKILLRDLPTIPLSNDNTVGGFATSVLPTAFGWDGLPAYFDFVKVQPRYSAPPKPKGE